MYNFEYFTKIIPKFSEYRKQLLYSLDQNHFTFYLTCTLVNFFQRFCKFHFPIFG